MNLKNLICAITVIGASFCAKAQCYDYEQDELVKMINEHNENKDAQEKKELAEKRQKIIDEKKLFLVEEIERIEKELGGLFTEYYLRKEGIASSHKSDTIFAFESFEKSNKANAEIIHLNSLEKEINEKKVELNGVKSEKSAFNNYNPETTLSKGGSSGINRSFGSFQEEILFQMTDFLLERAQEEIKASMIAKIETTIKKDSVLYPFVQSNFPKSWLMIQCFDQMKVKNIIPQFKAAANIDVNEFPKNFPIFLSEEIDKSNFARKNEFAYIMELFGNYNGNFLDGEAPIESFFCAVHGISLPKETDLSKLFKLSKHVYSLEQILKTSENPEFNSLEVILTACKENSDIKSYLIDLLPSGKDVSTMAVFLTDKMNKVFKISKEYDSEMLVLNNQKEKKKFNHEILEEKKKELEVRTMLSYIGEIEKITNFGLDNYVVDVDNKKKYTDLLNPSFSLSKSLIKKDYSVVAVHSIDLMNNIIHHIYAPKLNTATSSGVISKQDQKENVDLNEEAENRKGNTISKLTNFISLMSNVASETKGEGVKEIIEDFADPIGGWKVKNTNKYYFTLNSYLGWQFGAEKLNSSNKELNNQWGFVMSPTLPVGIEFGWSHKNNGHSGFGITLLDLGNLASYRLSGNEFDSLNVNVNQNSSSHVTFDQVFSPGGYFTWTPFENVPVSAMIGYQFSPSLRTLSGDELNIDKSINTSRVYFSIALDLTLFNFNKKLF